MIWFIFIFNWIVIVFIIYIICFNYKKGLEYSCYDVNDDFYFNIDIYFNILNIIDVNVISYVIKNVINVSNNK